MTETTQKILETLSVQMTPQVVKILGHLAFTGTVLALAQDLENAVIVRDGPHGGTERLGIVDRSVAMAMALQDWIVADNPNNRIVRYRITAAGRVALRDSDITPDITPKKPSMPKGRGRYGPADTPLNHLSRRKDSSGQSFLSADLIQAGERIREDFELASLDTSRTTQWMEYIKGADCPNFSETHTASEAAHARVAAALTKLGPGLGDVVLMCCCQLNGLEVVEKTLGWAARSGKIVLRIGLLHLVQHYETQTPSAFIG